MLPFFIFYYILMVVIVIKIIAQQFPFSFFEFGFS